MRSVHLRPARREDFATLKVPVQYRVRAIVGVGGDGEILGVGGLGFLPDGRKFAFTELNPAAHKHPISLHRAALRVLAMADAMGIEELYALSDMARSPAAERWLMKLGFVPDDTGTEIVWMRKWGL